MRQIFFVCFAAALAVHIGYVIGIVHAAWTLSRESEQLKTLNKLYRDLLEHAIKIRQEDVDEERGSADPDKSDQGSGDNA